MKGCAPLLSGVAGGARRILARPLTKKCTDAATTLIEPDRDWSSYQGLDFPRPKEEQFETFATHAWAFRQLRLPRRWGGRRTPERDFPFSACIGTPSRGYARVRCS